MAAKGKKFEDELKDLEHIVSQIDSGELSLEDAIGAFERGVALVKSLNLKLDEVQRKVELLTRNAEGQLESAVLAAESGARQLPEATDDEDIPF
jgi:exodeoxyribonuclease VII small subunit